jgi:gamma-glutamyltranspeptidase/glutathione hydrolase
VPGAGFFLNNEMDDFAALPGQPNMFGLVQGEQNKVEPGKRMLSSMTPTIVTKNNAEGGEELFMTIGAAGGPKIITAVLQIYLNVTRFGMNARLALDAPRIHHQHLPDLLYHEPLSLGAETKAALKAMGYRLEMVEHIAWAAAIMYGGPGNLTGWCDGNAAGAGR